MPTRPAPLLPPPMLVLFALLLTAPLWLKSVGLYQYLALEIKAQSRFSTPQLTGLRAIADLPRLVRRVLVYLGDRRMQTEDGIEVWPVVEFLTALAGDTLWP